MNNISFETPKDELFNSSTLSEYGTDLSVESTDVASNCISATTSIQEGLGSNTIAVNGVNKLDEKAKEAVETYIEAGTSYLDAEIDAFEKGRKQALSEIDEYIKSVQDEMHRLEEEAWKKQQERIELEAEKDKLNAEKDAATSEKNNCSDCKNPDKECTINHDAKINGIQKQIDEIQKQIEDIQEEFDNLLEQFQKRHDDFSWAVLESHNILYIVNPIIDIKNNFENSIEPYRNGISEIYHRHIWPIIEEYGYDIKEGNFDTSLHMNGFLGNFFNIQYSGKYIEFENEQGMTIKAPLAIVKYENGKIIFDPMTEEEQERYVEKVAQYNNDIMFNFENLYTYDFKQEITDRVTSTTILYIDRESRDSIDYARSYAAYCDRKNGPSKSDIVIYSDQFIELNPESDATYWYNSEDAYDYMVETYTHELGHAYANNHSFNLLDRDQSRIWNEIYNEVTGEDTNREFLGDYAFTNTHEFFADAIRYYYHDAERLKMIDIDVEGYNTLYDYMDYILQYTRWIT